MKNIIKKAALLLLAGVFVVSVSGCGNKSSNESSKSSNSSSEEVISDEKIDLGKVLIVYYSYTGNTEKLANSIKEKTNADIVEIEPVVPYSDDYDTVVDEAKEEENEDFKPEIKTKVDNLDSYDLILIGSPLWWYQIAPPVKTFLAQHDLSNKKTALFITHGGSGLAQSEDNIKDLCPNSNILKSIAINGDDIATSDTDKEVNAWLKGLK